MRQPLRLLALALLLASPAPALAQADVPSKVPVAFNRYYDYNELLDLQRRIADAYPDLVTLERIGASGEGREMFVAIVTSRQNGSHADKPAMWIDGNIHGNEVQASEIVLYTLWYLTKMYGHNESVTDLLDHSAFYLLISLNPDGRQHWFDAPHSPNSSRQNKRPVDDDLDGLLDEDAPEDLDGDGSITTMWIRDPNGRWLRSQTDDRIFIRAEPDQRGEWTRLGEEGLDNDGDGQINEDEPGGDDMNRNWPSDWQPPYIQFGAGLYPFSNPETRAVGMFLIAHPNVAAGQSYHNAGGMILQGPGVANRAALYAEDKRTYDEIADLGEDIIPYYDNLVIHKDLYTTHGGSITWMHEGLGILSYTNELWTAEKYFQRDVERPTDEQMWMFRDRLAFGQTFTPYKPFMHPQYGEVLLGGLNKWASRNTPTFMLEEECHRNFAFTMFHADCMARLEFARVDVQRLGERLWSVTAEVRNSRLIPTRLGVSRQKKIGRNDLFLCAAPEGGRVVAAGALDDWFDLSMDAARNEPHRLQVEGGVPGRGSVLRRFIVEAPEGAEVRLQYSAEKAMDVETTVRLR